MTRDVLVLLDRVTCVYDRTAVLVDVDLTIDRGRYVGVVGPSGSGKTTLLRTIVGTVTPQAGLASRRPGLRVGYVPQIETIDWNFPVTVREVVLMARRGRRLPWATKDELCEVSEALDRLGLGGLERRHIRELSGGQQQRVFIARALLGRPDLLLLDEPTAGVDVRTRHEVLHVLGDLNAQGLTIVLTTHDLNGVAAHLPELVCLNRRVIAQGAPDAVLTPDVLEQTYGARLDVLEHGGMRVVVDPHDGAHESEVVAFRRRSSE